MNWADYFYYDETSPSCLRWAVNIYNGEYRGRVLVAQGDVAGSINSNGYYSVGVNGNQYYVHKIIYEITTGNEVACGLKIDHEDGNRLNNVFSNLRLADNKANARNAAMRSHNTSGKCGVSWSTIKGCYYARAQWNNANGKPVARLFSVKKYGLLEAYALAAKRRDEAIKALNDIGAGYTERHGK